MANQMSSSKAPQPDLGQSHHDQPDQTHSPQAQSAQSDSPQAQSAQDQSSPDQSIPVRTPWNANLAKQSLKTFTPRRTDPKNAALIENIDKHPTLSAMTPGPDDFFFVQARASNKLTPGSHKEQ